MRPRMNLTAMSWSKLFTKPWHNDTTPQRDVMIQIYHDGRTFPMIIFEGS